MKKTTGLFIVLLCSCLWATSAFTASVDVTATIDENTREVTISGTISSGASSQVTVLVQSPRGSVDYVNQTTSGADGSFEFKYVVAEGQTGVYHVSLGGTDVEQVRTTTFEYTGNVSSERPVQPPIIIPDNELDPELSERGVIITPDAASIIRETRDGRTFVTVTINREQMRKAIRLLQNHEQDLPTITIHVKQEEAVHLKISSEVLNELYEAFPSAMLSLETKHGTYDVPVKAFSSKLKPQENRIFYLIVEPVADQINVQIAEQYGNLLVGALDFRIVVEENGVLEMMDDFGDLYIHRIIHLPRRVDWNRATGVLFDPEKKRSFFVPTIFEEQHGEHSARILRTGNSIYTVIEHHKTFADIAKSWAKADIELLASKLIMNGRSDTTFDPNGDVTRAEFAAMLVRSLGLIGEAPSNRFIDVKSADWFAEEVALAAQYSLVTGYDDLTFKPHQLISREEMAVMITRAMAFAGYDAAVVDQKNALLSKFRDARLVSSWAEDGVAAAIQAHIMNGVSAETFMPKKNATRAEAATILARMLKTIEFING